MMHALFLPVVALSAGSFAFPTSNSFAKTAVFESISAPPSRWSKQANIVALSKDESALELRIQLAHQGMDKFQELALNVCKTNRCYLSRFRASAVLR